jgi:microcystin-dependent protein
MRRHVMLALAILCGLSLPVKAQGVIPIALQQVMNANGQPVSGALLYIYQAGTVATPQNAFSDPGLTLPLSNPLVADATGRLPMFYLANGSVHVRLTDPSGVVIFDYPAMLVIGASGGASSGGSVDPTTILSTGDVKFRPTGESLVGWAKMNGQTIGSATSGATGRANADTQNLFVYLWTNCTNAHCAVIGGRGASALSDFNANKQIALPDWRGRIPVGLDDMGNTAAGILLASNVTNAGDTPTTPGGIGGEANHVLTIGEMPVHTPSVASASMSPPSFQAMTSVAQGQAQGGGGSSVLVNPIGFATYAPSASITMNSIGGSLPHNNMSPFVLGSWYVKL